MLFGKSGVVRSGLGQEKYGKLSILIFSHNPGAIPPISLSLSAEGCLLASTNKCEEF